MNTKAKDQRRRKYDDEFKRQALQMIANGQAVRSVAQALGIGENLLHKWKQAARASESPDEREVSELGARLRQVEQERDILKKCMAPPPESTAKRIMLAQGRTDATNVSGFC